MERFTNKSPGALTMEQAIERHKKSIAEDRRRLRQAREMAAQGRGEDTEIAHVALGELVVPRPLQSPEVLTALRRAASAHNIPLEMLSIGNAKNRINPNTGAPEFAFSDDFPGSGAAIGNYNFALPEPVGTNTYPPINIGNPIRPTTPLDEIMHGVTAIPRGVGEAIHKIGTQAFGIEGPATQRRNEYRQRMEDEYQAGRAAAGRTGPDYFSAIGEYGFGLGLPVARLLPKAVTYGGATAIGAAKGAIEGALKPVDDQMGSYWQQKADQVKSGAVQGAIEGRAKYLGKQAKDWFGF
jgi:hypothetical protein